MNIYQTSSRKNLIAGSALTILLLVGISRVSAGAFIPGDILVSSATYAGNSNTLTNGQILPYNTTNGVAAIANGTYFQVFNNDSVDANFGITAPITLSELSTNGSIVTNIAVPTNDLVTSFSSKSELALNLSSDGTSVSFAGYDAPVNAIDRSNSGTPGNTNDGNSPRDLATPTYRGILSLNSDGSFGSPTYINSYAGDNIRAAILTPEGYYTVGSSGQKTNYAGTGVQLVTPGGNPSTNAGSVGTYNFGDNTSKDNNYRGETIFNNTLFITKGSGSKGVDTVYQVGTAGTLPTGTNNAFTILPGFNTNAVGTGGPHPFGIWFANATTLYVADEGTGLTNDFGTTNNSYAGLEKWSDVGGNWIMDYNLTNGLSIGSNYSVTGTSGGVSGTYITATDGLRNIIGTTNSDGTVTIYALTSTASSTNGINNSADSGCDPNKLVSINDTLADTNASDVSGESFTTLETAAYGQVLRGVSFTPQPLPEPSTWALLGFSAATGFIVIRSRRRKN